jgi:hypothetical protein
MAISPERSAVLARSRLVTFTAAMTSTRITIATMIAAPSRIRSILIFLGACQVLRREDRPASTLRN